MKLAIALFLILLLAGATPVRAGEKDIRYDGPDSWAEFEAAMQEREHQDRVAGLSYLLSGAIATVGGIAGSATNDDGFSRSVFAISQTLGIAAMGYGASLYWNGNDYASFYRSVRDSSLSPAQKTELLKRFLAYERNERDRARWIRFGTHALLAAVNFYSASQEDNRDVRSVLQFLGGVNVILAVSYTF